MSQNSAESCTVRDLRNGQPAITGEMELQKGIAVLLVTNLLWALLPVYWKQLTHVSPLEVLSHRSLWGFILVTALLWYQGRMGEFKALIQHRQYLKFMAVCSMSHMFGWGFYIWAVGSGHIIDVAFGNYILPMLSVLCGFLVFRERPRRLQWMAIVFAAVGVLGMIVWYGTFPWIGLLASANSVIFAISRKHAPVNAMPGLILELLISAPILWGYLVYLIVTGTSTFGTVTVSQDLWLIGAGIVTIIPQMGYAYGLCRVPLTTISLMQYLPPTGNFLVGLLLFHEPFTPDKIFGFAFIWLGLIVFSLEGFYYRKTRLKLAYGPKP